MIQEARHSEPHFNGEARRLKAAEPIAKVLVVDDEAMILKPLRQLLEGSGYEVTTTDNPLEALALVRRERFSVALLDIRMPNLSGLELLERLKVEQPELEVVMMTGHGTVETTRRALKLGAYDYLQKPFEDIDDVAHVVAQALEHKRLKDRTRFLEQRVDVSDRFEDLIGRSPSMREVYERVELAAPTSSLVLIQGDSGTGKELIARAIHRRSPRSSRPLVSVHCGAIARTLLESEMFGHVRGAFTGADTNRKGHFEVADGATIFLDEIGEMALETQVALLRVLENGEITRVGSSETKHVDVRTIAATNRDLATEVAAGRFREDLYYRLNVITIHLPPLRDRREDVPLLAHHFLEKYAARNNKPVRAIAPDALDALVTYDWPGNVRELENKIEAAVVWARAEVVQLRDFPSDFRAKVAGPRPQGSIGGFIERPFAEAKALAIQAFEESYVRAMLERTHGNISEAARRSGLDRSNFRRVMLRHKDAEDSFR